MYKDQSLKNSRSQHDSRKQGTKPCKRGQQCYHLKKGTCWFYHPPHHLKKNQDEENEYLPKKVQKKNYQSFVNSGQLRRQTNQKNKKQRLLFNQRQFKQQYYENQGHKYYEKQRIMKERQNQSFNRKYGDPRFNFPQRILEQRRFQIINPQNKLTYQNYQTMLQIRQMQKYEALKRQKQKLEYQKQRNEKRRQQNKRLQLQRFNIHQKQLKDKLKIQRQRVHCPVLCYLPEKNRWFFQRAKHIKITKQLSDKYEQCTICCQQLNPFKKVNSDKLQNKKSGFRMKILSFFHQYFMSDKKQKDEYLTELYCSHAFHPQCIQDWFRKNEEQPTCPNCRSDFRKHNQYHRWDQKYEDRLF